MITVSAVERDRLKVTVRGHELYTDQPIEDGGDDTAPTPTELFLAGLASCVCYYAERFLRRHGLSVEGLEVGCDFSWAENPHRVGEIRLTVGAPALPETQRTAFERVIEHCTVHSTLRVPPAVNIALSRAPIEVA